MEFNERKTPRLFEPIIDGRRGLTLHFYATEPQDFAIIERESFYDLPFDDLIDGVVVKVGEQFLTVQTEPHADEDAALVEKYGLASLPAGHFEAQTRAVSAKITEDLESDLEHLNKCRSLGMGEAAIKDEMTLYAINNASREAAIKDEFLKLLEMGSNPGSLVSVVNRNCQEHSISGVDVSRYLGAIIDACQQCLASDLEQAEKQMNILLQNADAVLDARVKELKIQLVEQMSQINKKRQDLEQILLDRIASMMSPKTKDEFVCIREQYKSGINNAIDCFQDKKARLEDSYSNDVGNLSSQYCDVTIRDQFEHDKNHRLEQLQQQILAIKTQLDQEYADLGKIYRSSLDEVDKRLAPTENQFYQEYAADYETISQQHNNAYDVYGTQLDDAYKEDRERTDLIYKQYRADTDRARQIYAAVAHNSKHVPFSSAGLF